MKENFQKTVAVPVTFSGVGLHTGQTSKVTILPGKENEGVIFKRLDLKENNLIKANYKNVSSAKLCTTLENNHGVKVSTVEHLLAAFYITGIDNAIIEINCEEVPIMDGSAKEFLEIFKKTKLITQETKINFLKITEKIELVDGERHISIEPNDTNFQVDFQLNYKNKFIGNQRNIVNFQKDNLNEISESRTFCLYEDIEKIKKIGLAKGGSLDNAVVVAEDKILNSDGLRNEKEFVNHKILDLAGDFFLSGFKITGLVKCYQGGHMLTNMFLRKLLNTKNINVATKESDKIISKKEYNNHTKLAVNA
jgi:UDP-3-O-[3-hydroxymyristoyl] N-acetylglucosamine deacetylase